MKILIIFLILLFSCCFMLNNIENFSKFVIQGHSAPLKNIYTDDTKSLFPFKDSECKPECCPSTYSCDRGCICE